MIFFLLVGHRLFFLHCMDHQVTILVTPLIDTVAMVTMLWTFNNENCGTSLKKDSKGPCYMKQSLMQPTMMMPCREPQKQQTFYQLRNLFIPFLSSLGIIT